MHAAHKAQNKTKQDSGGKTEIKNSTCWGSTASFLAQGEDSPEQHVVGN